MPDFEVGAAGATAFSALVDGDELVVMELEEGDDALGLAVGAFDVTAGSADASPGAAEAAGPFGEEGVFGDAADHDGLDAVVHFVEVTGGELAVVGAAVEQGGGAGAEAPAFVHAVNADDFVFGVAVFFADIEAHGDAHPEELGRFEAFGGFDFFIDDEVAVVEGLDAEEVEVHVGCGVEGVCEFVEVELEEARVVAVDLDAAGEVPAEGAAVEVAEGFDAVTDDVPAEDFFIDVAEADAGGELGEVGVLLHEGLRVQDDGLAKVLDADVAVEGAAEFHLDLIARDAEVEAEDGEVDAFLEVGSVPEEGFSVGCLDEDEGLLLLAFLLIEDGGLLFFGLAHFKAECAVLDVGAGDFVEAAFHQLFFD